MLKHIPPSFTPEMLKAIMEMGHGEELLVADANYPGKTHKCKYLFTPHRSIPELLQDLLYFFPLDKAVPPAALVMESLKNSPETCKAIQNGVTANGGALAFTGRFDFYKQAEKAVYVFRTADATKGGNILLKKGVVQGDDVFSRGGGEK
jgi:L-fucose mutarotase